jgi:predicted GH43/DUF377 family glycosyl hydrolase
MTLPPMIPRRLFSRLLATPEDIPPRLAGFEVIGVFNPAAVAFDNGVALLLRVVERPTETRAGFVALPFWDVERTSIAIDWLPLSEIEIIDPRVVRLRATGDVRLTFISWLLPAFSRDGLAIDRIGDRPFMPATRYEIFGVEDPRLAKLDGRYYFTYVAVSPHGIVTALASTKDFQSYTRHGIIFCPENKDVILFPERVGGRYLAFHRPNPSSQFSRPEIWLARSHDLIHWGEHERLLGNEAEWATAKIGGGTPPVRTTGGWLSLYHGNIRPDAEGAARGEIGDYAAAALVQALDDPSRIVGMSRAPVMVAETDFERSGYLPNIVFPTAMLPVGDDLVNVYYGAADTSTAVTQFSIGELINAALGQRSNE